MPRHLDWDGHRALLASLAADELGRPVALQGAVRVTLLPQPMVEADDVIVGGGGPDDLRLAARALRLRLDLGALLRLRLSPREIALVGAEIRLPWPPATTPALRPPPWLTTFEARIEDSRVLVGDAVLEGVSAQFSAGGLMEAVRTEGRFAWRGAPVTFRAVVGRPGFDGVATLDLTLATGGASATARGVLVEEGGFEGRIEANAPDISAYAGVPAGPVRVAGLLAIGSELIAARELVLDFAGVPGRGAAALRLSGGPRLELAIQASRLDLDAWLAAFRTEPTTPIPVALDIAAESASFRGLALRRLRGALFREGDRFTFSDVTLLLPGETELEFEGATAGPRLELAARATGPSLRETLLALNLPVEAMDPARLRRFEARARIAIADGEIGVTDLAATIDDTRVTGAGVLRPGARPMLGMGLEIDRLDLDGLVPDGFGPASLASLGFDANLRLAASAVTWRGTTLERTALDAAIEGGRLLVRRLGLRAAGADIALSGTLATGAAARLSDAALEVAAADASRLFALLPASWRPAAGLSALPLVLRVTAGGGLDALGYRAEGELGDLRIEAAGNLDLPQSRIGGAITLRHPGAQRLIVQALGQEPLLWLGAGSFSLIATLALSPEGLTAESFALVAGEARAAGRAALALGGDRPRLTGRVQLDTLPLPGLFEDTAAPLGLERLADLDAELTLEIGRLVSEGMPLLTELRGGLVLGDGTLRVAVTEGQLSGGRIEGEARIEGRAGPPRAEAVLRLADLTIPGPVFGLPIDIAAGVLDGTVELRAAGHSLTALLGTLEGRMRYAMRNGVLQGMDLGAVPAAAELEDGRAAEAALQAALADGATGFDRLEVNAAVAAGRAVLDGTNLTTQAGAIASATGAVDLARATYDLELRIGMPYDAPDVALRLAGPLAAPRRLPDLAPWLRWRAER